MSHQKGKTPAIIGFVLFIISFVTLFCNEQNYVNSIKKANFAEQNAIELKSNYISPANDGKLVQLANSVYSNQILADGILTIPKAIALIRTTEMYQWEEYTTNNDGYQYRKNWNSFLINSDNFEKIEHKILKIQRYPDIPSIHFQNSHPYILPITQKVIYFKVYAVAYKSTKRKSLKPALKLSFKPLKLPQTGIEPVRVSLPTGF